MEDMINHIHKFSVGSQEIELKINYTKGLWMSKIIKGETGMGSSSGGKFETLNEYISNLEKEHQYAYNFFNHGYKYAKSAQ